MVELPILNVYIIYIYNNNYHCYHYHDFNNNYCYCYCKSFIYEDFNVVADNKTKETKHTNKLRTTTTIFSGRPQLPFRKFHLDILDTLTWAVPSRFTCW